MEGVVQQLSDGRFILAAWVACASEWYAVEAGDEFDRMTSRTVDDLATKPGVRIYATRDDPATAAQKP